LQNFDCNSFKSGRSPKSGAPVVMSERQEFERGQRGRKREVEKEWGRKRGEMKGS